MRVEVTEAHRNLVDSVIGHHVKIGEICVPVRVLAMKRSIDYDNNSPEKRELIDLWRNRILEARMDGSEHSKAIGVALKAALKREVISTDLLNNTLTNALAKMQLEKLRGG